MRPWIALFLLPLAPTAAAEAYLHAWLEPAEDVLVLPAGGRAVLEYGWHVALENTTCTSDVEVGVDFIVGESPIWAGASFQPMGDRVFAPGGEGVNELEILVESEPPGRLEGRILLAIEVNPYNLSNCVPDPTRYLERANLTLSVEPTTSPVATDGAGRTPSPRVVVVLAAIGVALVRLDALHRNRSPGRF